MNRITDRLSKPVVAASEGVTAGIVINLFTDKKLARVRGYKVVNDESDEARILPLRRVLGDADALVVKSVTALLPAAFPECPLGAKVFDTAGALIGTLRDLVFDPQSGAVLSLVVDQAELSAKDVLNFCKDTVVLRAPVHEKTQFKKPAKRAARSVALSNPAPEKPQDAADFPFRDYAFLLGRRLKKTILNGDAVVANEGDPVTPEVILRARESGKLVELTVNSRK